MIRSKPSLRIAAMTQAYQEEVMLPLWVRHYSALVGRENLVILDHGSEPPVRFEGVRIEIIPRSEIDEWDRINGFSEWQTRLLADYDWVINVDTDEFVVARPDRWTSIEERLSVCPPGTRRCVGVEVIDPGNTSPLDWSQPILGQRPLGVVKSWSCKPAVSSVPTSWTPGFHTANTPSIFDHNLWLFHLKFADLGYLLRRLALTRSLKWSEAMLTSGLSASHRVPDHTMRQRLAQYQARHTEGTLDDYLATNPDPNSADSPLLRIPDALLTTL